jgi:hypothetical protein
LWRGGIAIEIKPRGIGFSVVSEAQRDAIAAKGPNLKRKWAGLLGLDVTEVRVEPETGASVFGPQPPEK